jgi:hypothetical protein
LHLTRGSETSAGLILEGKPDKNLAVISSDSETLTSRPQWIFLNVSEAEVGALNGKVTIMLDVATNTALIPGDYTLLISVTDGLVTRGIYLTLTVSH